MILERLGRPDQLGGAMLLQLENGVRAVRLQSVGGVDALVILDRAMDIAACSFQAIPLVWHGPGGIHRSSPGTRDTDAFERSFFGGLVTTCGLDAFGPAGSDEDGSWGEHGHVNHCAAELTKLEVDVENEECFVELRGVVRQARMFGESLRLERTWRMNRAGTHLRLHDRVVNEGGATVPHMLLYHCNAGYPLLGEQTRVSISQSAMRPRDARAREGLEVWNRGGPPTPGFQEQVFIHHPVALESGWAIAEIANRELGLALGVRFRPEQLPACFSWRMLGARTYVMAVEPANCPTVQGRIEARKRGTLPMLAPGEERSYDVEFHFGAGTLNP